MLYLVAFLTLIWSILLISSLVVPDTYKQKIFAYLLLVSALLLPLQSLKGWAALVLVPGLLVAYLLMIMTRFTMKRFETSSSHKLIFYSSWSLVAVLVSLYICVPGWDDSQHVVLLGFIPSTANSIGTTILSTLCSLLWWIGIITAIFAIYVALHTRQPKQNV